jgi:hypothetical protein
MKKRPAAAFFFTGAPMRADRPSTRSLPALDAGMRFPVLLPHAQLLHHAVRALAGVLALPLLRLLLLLSALRRLVLVRGVAFGSRFHVPALS